MQDILRIVVQVPPPLRGGGGTTAIGAAGADGVLVPEDQGQGRVIAAPGRDSL